MKTETSLEYRMGFDCGQHGPNTTNCNFSLFSAPEKTAEWERGKRDGAAVLTEGKS